MSKLLMGIIAAMGSAGFLYYQFAVVPMKNKLEEQTAVIIAQDLRDQEQKATIAAITLNAEKTAAANAQMQQQNQQYEAEMSEYLDIFRRHNLAKIASARPGQIQTQANARTKEVFDAIEEVSNRISNPNP
jgi:CHAT domain-containing protein